MFKGGIAGSDAVRLQNDLQKQELGKCVRTHGITSPPRPYINERQLKLRLKTDHDPGEYYKVHKSRTVRTRTYVN